MNGGDPMKIFGSAIDNGSRLEVKSHGLVALPIRFRLRFGRPAVSRLALRWITEYSRSPWRKEYAG